MRCLKLEWFLDKIKIWGFGSYKFWLQHMETGMWLIKFSCANLLLTLAPEATKWTPDDERSLCTPHPPGNNNLSNKVKRYSKRKANVAIQRSPWNFVAPAKLWTKKWHPLFLDILWWLYRVHEDAARTTYLIIRCCCSVV